MVKSKYAERFEKAKVKKQDPKLLTQQVLSVAADWVESPNNFDRLFGLKPTTRINKEALTAYIDARDVAVNYIRMGAKG